jgi:hypothetical protein
MLQAKAARVIIYNHYMFIVQVNASTVINCDRNIFYSIGHSLKSLLGHDHFTQFPFIKTENLDQGLILQNYFGL